MVLAEVLCPGVSSPGFLTLVPAVPGATVPSMVLGTPGVVSAPPVSQQGAGSSQGWAVQPAGSRLSPRLLGTCAGHAGTEIALRYTTGRRAALASPLGNRNHLQAT